MAELHGPAIREALGARLTSVHELPPGEAAKSAEICGQLWQALRLERGGTLVAAAREAGCVRVVDGLEVLVRQGAASFERWTGVPAPVDVMRAALRE